MRRTLKNIVGIVIIGSAAQVATVSGQPAPVVLTQMVLTAGHRETISVPGSNSTTQLIGVRSGNQSVATARGYRANQIEVVAVAPGKTNIEFMDSSTGKRYVQSVWVEAANPTGGGGSGNDSTKMQLPQVVMEVKHTENIEAPGDGDHQLSGVVSSNPSVATARTNTANTIQVYAKALGDTWINFTDNATGMSYKVHVWVMAAENKPPAGGNSSGTKPKPKPKPGTKPVVAGPSGKSVIEPCLVGQWISDSPDTGYGVTLNIEKNGRVSINYSGYRPEQSGAGTRTAAGTAVVYMLTTAGTLYLEKVESSTVVYTTSFPEGGVSTLEDPYGGNAKPLTTAYTCKPDSFSNWKQVYRRVSP